MLEIDTGPVLTPPRRQFATCQAIVRLNAPTKILIQGINLLDYNEREGSEQACQ
jgi:hypothetical protein